jgi:hypothetical protein
MKFLTHDGLLYFWKKVKNYVDTKDTAINNALASKSNKSTATNVTLSASSWSGSAAPYSYTISNSNITDSNMIEFVFPSGTAQSVVDMWGEAAIGRYSQSAGSIILYANGTKPTASMTVTMIIRRDV